MTAIIMIIGGAVGGGLGWLLDRRAAKRGGATTGTQPGSECQTGT